MPRFAAVLEAPMGRGAIAWVPDEVMEAKEYAVWIAEAKRPETRERRVAETLQRLRTTRK